MIFFVLGLMVFSACHNYKKDTQQLMVLKDSLEQEAAFKDESIAGLLSDFSEIQENLDKIKELEKLVTVQSNTKGELSSNQKQKVMEDIMLLNGLLQKNKELIASLQKKLKNSNVQISQLEGTLKQLQAMVNNLETEMQGKNEVIMSLAGQVEKLNIDMSALKEKIIFTENESRVKSETIESQTQQLNKAFFAFGSTKELRDFGIIEKSGGVLGVGKTPLIRKDFDRDYFTEVDIRKVGFIPLMVKKAKLISVHPEGSFHFSGQKSADTLFIDNREEFWKASKYLVIVTD